MARSRGKSQSRSRKWAMFFSANSKEDLKESAPTNSTPPPVSNSRSKDDLCSKEQISGNLRSKTPAKKKSSTNERNKSREECGDKDKEENKEKKKDKRNDKGDKECEASVFETVDGPSQPAQTGTHGIKNKMRWKIDVDPTDANGEQKMEEVIEKLRALLKKKKVKLRKKPKNKDKSTDYSEEDYDENVITCAKILQLVNMQKIVEKEVPESDREILKNFCRCESDPEKAEPFIEKIAVSALSAIVTKNEMCRVVSIPGQLRLYAVDDKVAKYPMIALLTVRRDLLYLAYTKSGDKPDSQPDSTWNVMTAKKATSDVEKKDKDKEKEKEKEKDKEKEKEKEKEEKKS